MYICVCVCISIYIHRRATSGGGDAGRQVRRELRLPLVHEMTPGDRVRQVRIYICIYTYR